MTIVRGPQDQIDRYIDSITITSPDKYGTKVCVHGTTDQGRGYSTSAMHHNTFGSKIAAHYNKLAPKLADQTLCKYARSEYNTYRALCEYNPSFFDRTLYQFTRTATEYKKSDDRKQRIRQNAVITAIKNNEPTWAQWAGHELLDKPLTSELFHRIAFFGGLITGNKPRCYPRPLQALLNGRRIGSPSTLVDIIAPKHIETATILTAAADSLDYTKELLRKQPENVTIAQVTAAWYGHTNYVRSLYDETKTLPSVGADRQMVVDCLRKSGIETETLTVGML